MTNDFWRCSKTPCVRSRIFQAWLWKIPSFSKHNKLIITLIIIIISIWISALLHYEDKKGKVKNTFSNRTTYPRREEEGASQQFPQIKIFSGHRMTCHVSRSWPPFLLVTNVILLINYFYISCVFFINEVLYFFLN